MADEAAEAATVASPPNTFDAFLAQSSPSLLTALNADPKSTAEFPNKVSREVGKSAGGQLLAVRGCGTLLGG